jgi:hypothetical protein
MDTVCDTEGIPFQTVTCDGGGGGWVEENRLVRWSGGNGGAGYSPEAGDLLCERRGGCEGIRKDE